MSDQSIYPPPVPHMLGFKHIKLFPGYAASYDYVRAYVWCCRKRNGKHPSSIGREWREIKQSPNMGGYLKVSLYRDRKITVMLVHQIIGSLFLGQRPKRLITRHGIAGRHCNLPSNLCYGTHRQNSQDMVDHGCSLKGSRNPFSKLNERRVTKIILDWNAGAEMIPLAKEHSVTHGAIWNIIKGNAWAHVVKKIGILREP